MRRPPLVPATFFFKSCSHAPLTPIHLTCCLSPSPSKRLAAAVHNTTRTPRTSTLCVSNFCLHEVAETIASMLDYTLICESGYVARLSCPCVAICHTLSSHLMLSHPFALLSPRYPSRTLKLLRADITKSLPSRLFGRRQNRRSGQRSPCPAFDRFSLTTFVRSLLSFPL